MKTAATSRHGVGRPSSLASAPGPPAVFWHRLPSGSRVHPRPSNWDHSQEAIKEPGGGGQSAGHRECAHQPVTESHPGSQGPTGSPGADAGLDAILVTGQPVSAAGHGCCRSLVVIHVNACPVKGSSKCWGCPSPGAQLPHNSSVGSPWEGLQGPWPYSIADYPCVDPAWPLVSRVWSENNFWSRA